MRLQVGSVSELRISMRRLGAFLSLPEPPKPWHATPGASAGSGGGATANGRDGAPGGQQETPAAAAEAAVEVAGADFDWADRSWAEPAAAAAPAAGSARDDEPAAAAAFQAVQATAGQQAAGEAAPAPPAFQLRGLRFSVARGSLVGIVGTVGSGAPPQHGKPLFSALPSQPTLPQLPSSHSSWQAALGACHIGSP